MSTLHLQARQAPRIEVLRASEPGGRPVFRLDYVGQDEAGQAFRIVVSDHYDLDEAIGHASRWRAQGVAIDDSAVRT